MKNNDNTHIHAELTKKQRKIIRTKNIILDAAEALFNEKTYENVKVEDIAERAVLSKATVYNYFYSKEGIYYGIGVRAFHMINDLTAKLFLEKKTGIEILEELILRNMKGRKDFPLYNEITNRFLLLDRNLAEEIIALSRNRKNRLLDEDDPKINKTHVILADYLDQFRIFTQFWGQIIQKGVKDGTIITEWGAEEVKEFIFLIINGIVQLLGSNYLFHENIFLTEEQAYNQTVVLIKKFLGKPGII